MDEKMSEVMKNKVKVCQENWGSIKGVHKEELILVRVLKQKEAGVGE